MAKTRAPPHPQRAEIGDFEKAELFTVRCYKAIARTSTEDETLTMFTEIFDTGTGPNLVREDVLPIPWLEKVQPI